MDPHGFGTEPDRIQSLRTFLNPAVRRDPGYRGLMPDDEFRDVHGYFAAHPELAPSPLRSLPAVASAAGIGRVDAKDETGRFGLNAFKIVGVRYAVHRLGDEAAARGLVCATAGNHGRAVARVARQKRVPCTVFIPAAGSPRIQAMRNDGATVIEVNGSYEDAVRRAAAHGHETGATIVSDTSWDGYEDIPRWIMAGYTQIFEEAYSQWDVTPDVVCIQGGVGGLVCAAANWFAWRFGPERPFLIACEPESAACLLESAQAGAPSAVRGDLHTIMACLQCAEPSPAAWPAIAAGIDAFVTISDPQAIEAVHALAISGIDAGPSGACGVAAIGVLASVPVPLDRSTRALVVVTEGA